MQLRSPENTPMQDNFDVLQMNAQLAELANESEMNAINNYAVAWHASQSQRAYPTILEFDCLSRSFTFELQYITHEYGFDKTNNDTSNLTW